MSVAGISSSFSDYSLQSVQSRIQQFKSDFQQLGQDLSSGNLSAAQTDFATLQSLAPKATSTSSAESSNSPTQAFQQLSQDLQSGNISAAQQDYAKIQQDFQSKETGTTTHGHRHHGGGGGGGSEISQLMTQLNQSLQSGNLSAAQQSYSTLLTDLTQFGEANGLTSSSQSGSNSVSVNA